MTLPSVMPGPDDARSARARLANLAVGLAVTLLMTAAVAAPPSVSAAGDPLAGGAGAGVSAPGVSEPVVRVGLAVDATQARLACEGEVRVWRRGSRMRGSVFGPGVAFELQPQSAPASGNERGSRGSSQGGRAGAIRLAIQEGPRSATRLGEGAGASAAESPRGGRSGWRTLGSFAEELIFEPLSAGRPLQLDGKPYHGEILVRAAPRGDRLVVVNAVRMEDYLRGVVPLEMGSGASVPWSALEAQAIAARCYALFCLDRHEDEYRCDLLAGPEDQVYGGIAAETPEANQAVSNTRGIVAVSGGRPIRANYCSTCGGRTEANHRVWEAQAPLPYLRSIRDDSFGGCLCADSPYHRWEERWGCEELNASVLKHLPTEVPEARGVRLGRVRDLQVVERSPSGRAAVLRVVTEGGSFEVRGDRIRWVVRRADGGPLRSTYFDRFRRIGGKDCTIGLKGAGYGHGVGMCQFGAREMGRQGSSAAEILGHYYHGIALVRWW